MVKFWIITGVIFLVLILIIAKFTLKYYKKENSEKMWKVWGIRTAYWEGVVVVSSFINHADSCAIKVGQHFDSLK